MSRSYRPAERWGLPGTLDEEFLTRLLAPGHLPVWASGGYDECWCREFHDDALRDPQISSGAVVKLLVRRGWPARVARRYVDYTANYYRFGRDSKTYRLITRRAWRRHVAVRVAQGRFDDIRPWQNTRGWDAW